MLPTRQLTRDEMDELNTLGLLHICQTIHMHCHQPEKLRPQDLITAVSWITYKVERWHTPSTAYDTVVKTLCEITLTDLEDWLERHKEYYTLEDK